MKTPVVIRTVTSVRTLVSDWRQQGACVGLVPTMGALHHGHLSLIAEADRRAARVIVSIFVNPRQFGASEDLDRYPRNFDQDRARIAAQGLTDAIFVPDGAEIYREGFATEMRIGGPAL